MLEHLRDQGFEVEEGKCLRARHKHVSGPKDVRAAELMRFWRDPDIRAIMPPWGGELLVEILPLLDFEELRSLEPKWISGYSDISTLHLPLTILAGVATVHGSNLMDLSPSQTDPLTNGLMKILQLEPGSEFEQNSSSLHQVQWLDFRTQVSAPLNLTEPTQWKKLRGGDESVCFSGRLIGGCLDTVARLVGTPYGDVKMFSREAGSEGTIVYFENCELSVCEWTRTLWNIKLAGWFENVSGVLIGRSNGPEANSPDDLSYLESLVSVLGDLKMPILYDVDIGHRPPQLSILNGSLGMVEFSAGKGKLRQKLI